MESLLNFSEVNLQLILILMTNLSAPFSFYKKLPPNMEIVCGFHSKFNNVDRYLKKAILINERFEKFVTILLIHEENYKALGSRINDFKKLDLDITVTPLLDDDFLFEDTSVDYGVDYDGRFLVDKSEVVDKDLNRLSEEEAVKIRSFFGMFCFPNINIKSNGAVEICTVSKKYHISSLDKVPHRVLCINKECSDCGLANPKVSISRMKEIENSK